MEKTVSKEQIERVAELSNLDLTKDEISKYSSIFTDILGYINVLSEMKLDEVSPTFQVTGLHNVFSSGEENEQTLSQEDALSNASKSIRGLFATEAVFDR